MPRSAAAGRGPRVHVAQRVQAERVDGFNAVAKRTAAAGGADDGEVDLIKNRHNESFLRVNR
jgi:hypothetical protein